MGRRKIEIKAIKDDRNRSVTFLKRKGGLFKKAHELAVLCSVDVAVIIFGHNKKLYEYSSCEMCETMSRYQYFGPPHEHKGPEDFNGKRDDDDDEDETTPAPEEIHQAQQTQQGPPPMGRPHIPSHPGFQHINHAPSASPPISNGMHFAPRHGTPQPHGVSRPSSRNHMRRVSSNLAPQQHATPPPAPPPPQNGFAYMANPSMYHPNTNPNLSQHHRPGPFAQFSHTPPVTHHQTPPPQRPHQSLTPQPMPAHTMPSQSIPQHPMAPPHPHQFAHPAPPMAVSQPPHPPMSQVAQAYMHEQGRNSMPPAFTSEPPQQSQLAPPRTASLPGAPPTDQVKPEGSHSPPTHQRSLSSKSRSIFTPIDDRGSVLARHFGLGASAGELARGDASIKPEPKPDDSNETKSTDQSVIPPPPPRRVLTEPSRTQSVSSISSDINPPTRTNSGQSKRPQLKVQIPSENSDRESATADSSSRDSAGNKALTPAKASQEPNHSGVVLPPPSPSAGAILSAGVQGPPNPFARPPPPVTTNNTTTTTTQNNNAYTSNNNIETPISALPSRFVSDALLPSPSSFFPEWGFGRSGPDTNMLPSPLTFPTPAGQTGPGFGREDEQDKKRKTPDSGPSGEGASKKTKT